MNMNGVSERIYLALIGARKNILLVDPFITTGMFVFKRSQPFILAK